MDTGELNHGGISTLSAIYVAILYARGALVIGCNVMMLVYEIDNTLRQGQRTEIYFKVKSILIRQLGITKKVPSVLVRSILIITAMKTGENYNGINFKGNRPIVSFC